MRSALAGRAVLLTRGAADDAPLLRALRACGALALSLACVRIEPCADPEQLRAGLRDLTADDWLVLTSRAAADAVAGAAPDLRARVAAVGPATAERAAARGLAVSFVPSRPTGADLARELPLTGGVALLARSDRALPDLPAILAGRGVRVREAIAYRTVPGVPAGLDRVRAALAGRTLDAAVFASPSAVEGFVRDAAATLPAPRAVVAIGPTTAAHAGRRLRPDVVSARRPDAPGVLAALERALREAA